MDYKLRTMHLHIYCANIKKYDVQLRNTELPQSEEALYTDHLPDATELSRFVASGDVN